MPQENSLELLDKFVKGYKIFIDTSSLLLQESEKFFQNIVPLLEREKKSLILPLSVYRELQKLANDPAYCRQKHGNNPELNMRAIRACKNVVRLHQARLVEVFADPDDGDFADNVFLHVLTKKRMQYDMLLITQDRGLASEATRIGKENRAVHGMKKILVQRIGKNGSLQRIIDSKATPQTDSEEIPLNERFAFTKEVMQIPGRLPVSKIPTTGDSVTATRNGKTKPLRLLDELGRGGEGSVYKTNIPGYVAKIYNPEKITRLRYKKLELMLTKNIDCEGVCFPLAMILNQRNEFVGYLMRTASGRDLGKSVFMPMLLKKYFPRWNKIDTVQLCVTLLKKLKYLHDRNIILGDINPYNILVVSPKEVYFVDTDSYQVEGFICPVGMPLFTAPELQNQKEYGLRTLGNENFAVATLLFMIMHPGKPPYAMQDGIGIKENIISGEFSYPFGERKTGKVPKGPWRFCWSHLTYQLKSTFYETFWRNGNLHSEKKRPSTGYWLRLFETYLESLKSGKMSEWDEEALLIFPTRFKKDRNKTYAKCKLCGKEYDEESLEQGICRTCLSDGDKYHCERCGREMIYTNYQKYIKHAKRYKICRDCYEKRNTIWNRRTCKNCGRMFEITLGEKEYFDKKGFALPTRCENCRGRSQATQIHREVRTPAQPTTSSVFDWIRNFFN